jgi:hypothetical protein
LSFGSGGNELLREGKENEVRCSEVSDEDELPNEENVEVGEPRGTKDDAEGLSREGLGVDGLAV